MHAVETVATHAAYPPQQAAQVQQIPQPAAQPVSNSVPRYGTVIPNRVFVGGIDFKTKEEDLQKYFCKFGVVRDTKIIRDRAEVSKGYGFVTFDTNEDADKVRDQQESLYLGGKKLNIGPAVRKQQLSFPKAENVQGPPSSWVIHPAGYASYTNQNNGITYFSQPPVIAGQLQPQSTMLYSQNNVATYQPHHVTYAPQYTLNPGQQYNTVHMPAWNAPTVPGSCGQLVAPTHEQVNIVNVPQTPSYIVPARPNIAQAVPVAAANQTAARSCEAAMTQDKVFMSACEPVRLMIPPAQTAGQSHQAYQVTHAMQSPTIIHNPTAVYAHQAAHQQPQQQQQRMQQFISAEQHQQMFHASQAHHAGYGLITIPEENHQMSSEGENGFTPPVSPNKSQ